MEWRHGRRGRSLFALLRAYRAVVVLGVVFGHVFVNVLPGWPVKKGSLMMAFASEDGAGISRLSRMGISTTGGAVDGSRFSPGIQFWPALESCGRLRSSRSSSDHVHFALCAAFFLAAVYVRQRESIPICAPDYVLLAMGLMPATLFFRMAYSESLFLLLCIVMISGDDQKVAAIRNALIVGLATAVRPVGMGLLAPFVLHCLHRSSTRWRFLLNIAYLVANRLLGYSQLPSLPWECALAIPFVFVKAQSHWGLSSVPLSEKATALLAFEPIWQVFDPGSAYYWAHRQPYPLHPLFCLGARQSPVFRNLGVLDHHWRFQRWLSSYETTLAVCPVAHPLLRPGLRDGYEFTSSLCGRRISGIFGNWQYPGSPSRADRGVTSCFECILPWCFLRLIRVVASGILGIAGRKLPGRNRKRRCSPAQIRSEQVGASARRPGLPIGTESGGMM